MEFIEQILLVWRWQARQLIERTVGAINEIEAKIKKSKNIFRRHFVRWCAKKNSDKVRSIAMICYSLRMLLLPLSVFISWRVSFNSHLCAGWLRAHSDLSEDSILQIEVQPSRNCASDVQLNRLLRSLIHKCPFLWSQISKK